MRVTRLLITSQSIPGESSSKYIVGSVLAFPELGTPPEVQDLVQSLHSTWLASPGYSEDDPDTDFIDILLANGFQKDEAVPSQMEFDLDRYETSESESA